MIVARRRVCVGAAVVLVGALAGAATAGADSIGRANLDGSRVQPGFITMASALPGSSVAGLAVDGGHIYWASPVFHPAFENPGSGTIGRANVNGSSVEPRFLSVPLPRQHGGIVSGPSSVVVGAGHIFWATEEVIPPLAMWGYVGRANLDGSGVEPNFIIPGVLQAVDDAHIYWSAGDRIGRANLDGSGVEPNFIAGASGSLALDAQHIYWSAGDRIGRANLDGSGVEHNFIGGLTAAGFVAVGGGHIYWTDLCSSAREACSSDRIGRANLDGSDVQRSLITVPQSNLGGGLAVDDANVYWGGSPRPTLLALRVTPQTFTLTGRLVNGRCVPQTRANRGRGPCTRPIKLKIGYRLNLPADGVVFRIQRRVAGRLIKGRCVASNPANRGNPGCIRLIPYPRQETLFQTGKVGWNSLTFNGIIVTHKTQNGHVVTRRHKLTPGSYLLTASISPSNNKTTTFRIAR